MDNKLLWINEGFVLDDAGDLVTTSYVDLRAPANRTAIQTLVKGCRREHALEDAERILAARGRSLFAEPCCSGSLAMSD